MCTDTPNRCTRADSARYTHIASFNAHVYEFDHLSLQICLYWTPVKGTVTGSTTACKDHNKLDWDQKRTGPSM